MDVKELLLQLSGRDIRLWREGDQLAFDAPAGALSRELRNAIIDNKSALLGLLSGTPANDLSLIAPFEKFAESQPNQFALVDGSRSLTFRELNEQANRLAHWLRALGAETDTRIGIALPRSAEAVVAILAVLKSGAGYVPLDPALPRERLSYILQDADPLTVITKSIFSSKIEDRGGRTLEVDAEFKFADQDYSSNLPVVGDAKSLAYLIYTSGSTGRPKGVLMPRGPLDNLIRWMRTAPDFQPGCRVMQYPPISFDVHFQDIVGTLCAGGTVILPSEAARRDPNLLWENLIASRATRIHLPVVMLHRLADAFHPGKHSANCLQKIVCAGEALVIAGNVRSMFEALPNCRLTNEYGPSETHVVTAYELPHNPADWPERVPIGRPIANVSAVLRDADGFLISKTLIGEIGELLIGGAAPALGYLHDVAKTEEKFVRIGEDRFYATGDLASWDAEGDLHYHGRADRQLKIRGYRVEPGDIEAALRSALGLVREAAVIAHQLSAEDRRLVAYVSLSDSGPEDHIEVEAILRETMAQRLPEYMVPALFVFVERLPLTANGKVDFAALPPPMQIQPVRTALPDSSAGAESVVRSVWAEALKRSDLSDNANFFDSGGDSLLLMQVQAALERECRVEIPITVFFENTTIPSLARWIDGQVSSGSADNPSIGHASSQVQAGAT